jgi:hypothetical protein
MGRCLLWALVTLLALGSVGGCRALGVRNFANENDRLRRENLELTNRVKELQRQFEQAREQVRRLTRRLEDPDQADRRPSIDPDLVPTLTDLRIDDYSGWYAPAQSQAGDVEQPLTLKLYLRPLDQKGRLLPSVGRLTVQLVSIEPDRQPREVLKRTFSPVEFDEAYRSGLLGTHYAFDMACPPLGEWPEDAKQITLRVTFETPLDGQTLAAQKSLPWPPPDLATKPGTSPESSSANEASTKTRSEPTVGDASGDTNLDAAQAP